MTKILVIEDDPDIALSLKYNLERSGSFDVSIAGDGAAGLESIRKEVPGMILLDLNLPGMDGTEVCKVLRSQENTASVPIIMLTARTEEEDRISGLDLGADDYVSKPFSVKELIARVRAVLRRTGARDEQEQVLAAGPVEIDLPAHRVLVAGEPVELTRKEFDLLTALIRSRGRVLTRDHLLERVWGYAYPGETRTVDVHIRRLRKKLGDRVKDHIETVVGVGYRFRSER